MAASSSAPISTWPAGYVVERAAIELIGNSAAGVGYLQKDRVADLDAFTDAIRRVAAGGSALDPDVVERLLGRGHGDPLAELTPSEREVLALMAEGRSTRASPNGSSSPSTPSRST
jgi:DNA-binding NarL/FixJ family response regulator